MQAKPWNFIVRTLTIVLGLLICLPATAQRTPPLDISIDFESYDPPSTLVVPENPRPRAKFPFIDIHSHQWRMADGDLSGLAAAMDSLNMQIVVNLSGRNSQILKRMTENIDSQGYAKRMVVFSNIDFRTIDEYDWEEQTMKQLDYDVSNGARGLKIYKSQGMSHVDSKGQRIPLNHPKLDAIWNKCGELGIPVLIHAADPKPFWMPHDSLNERWLELKLRPGRKRAHDDPAPWETIIGEQHDIIRRHKNTKFINAHFGWYANDLQKLGELLDEMPNMYVETGAIIAELGRQPRMARKFFEQYQDRILFGKDSFQPSEYPTYFRVLETADEYFPYYKRYHAFWRMYGLDLPDDILKKVYYKNALRIVPGLDASLFPE
ncbi:MAG: amidohydrolase family protein [Saprospiraceae bacterium]|nr:amidohydrolase family protein [Saprospiraceae bacterium]